MLGRLAVAIVSINRLSGQARLITSGPLLAALQAIARKWSMNIVPALAQAEHTVVPKVVGLLRLSPALPFSLQNWFLGITPVNFWPAQIATFFGIMPGTLLYVLIGSAGGSAAAGGDDMGFAKWIVLTANR